MATPGEKLARRLAVFLVAARWPLLGIAVVLAAASYYPSSNLDFDRSIEKMFADDDPILPPYQKLKEKFGGNEIVIGVYRDDDLLDPSGAGVRRVAKVDRQVKKIEGVRDALSLGDIQGIVKMMASTGVADPDSQVAAEFRRLFAGYTHSKDGKTAAVVVMLVPEKETNAPRRETIEALRAVFAEHPDGQIVGEPVMVVDGFQYVEEDGARLAIWSTILMGLTILLCFRSLRWVVIPLAVVQLTLLLTRGLLVLAGIQLSMVSSMLTAIVTVVGVATVVHIVVRYREARADGLTPRDALVHSGEMLIAPIFWACMTDAVGFLSLRFAEVGPVRDFGLMMALGSVLVLVSVSLIAPGLTLLGSFDADPKRAYGEHRLDGGLAWVTNAVKHRPWWFAAILLGLLVVAGIGLSRLQVETDFTNNFRQGSPITRSYAFVETKLGGAGAWDIILPAPKFWDDDYIARLLSLENKLREIEVVDANGNKQPALNQVLSLADAEDVALFAVQKNRWLRMLMPTPEIRLKGMQTTMHPFKFPAAPRANHGAHFDGDEKSVRPYDCASDRPHRRKTRWL